MTAPCARRPEPCQITAATPSYLIQDLAGAASHQHTHQTFHVHVAVCVCCWHEGA